MLLVDDHQLYRGGLRQLLEEEGLAVVGEAPSGRAAVELARELAPDVVIMDLNMPGMSGVEATRRVAAVCPSTRVLVLTISADQKDLIDAVMAGACGYLVKDASTAELVRAIRGAAAGESLISPRIAGDLLSHVRERTAVEEAEVAPAELSEREREVLKLVAEGKDNAEIAAALFLSQGAVKKHISNILMKLQVENRIQAAVYAVRSVDQTAAIRAPLGAGEAGSAARLARL
ncbi:MAG: response regulator transcription factor [Actinobacteria bacterium]|nr:response regulator transcription factor [Actinomycetota bacterium]